MDMPWAVAALLGESDPRWMEHALGTAHVGRRALANLGQLAAATYPTLEQRVGEVLRAALQVDLGGLALAAWSSYRELVEAAERTRDAPGAPEDVVLAEHEITWSQRLAVEVIVNGTLRTTLQFDLAVSLTMRGVVAVVGAGMLAGLRVGDVLAGARLALWEQELAAREVTCLVGALVRLGDGVPLVAGAGAPSPTALHVPG
ncbi:hypothetical protein [Pseudonocardia adelaidensis]|uniref:Uncharacterized protein n=1 Tax=Pseudonocardia adelaidensis TaxID=648754 RepID=A0ABP9P2Q1_9PSEU